MANSTIRKGALHIGLIGCGQQAPKHIAGLKSVGEPVQITVADINSEFASAIGAAHDVEVATSVRELLDNARIDGVIVATPTPTHVPLIEQALSRGKHVFCEKPLCADPSEAERLKAQVQASGKLLQVGYVYRFVPAFNEIHNILRLPNPPLGTPVSAIFRIGGRGSAAVWKHRKETGGGAINEMLVHMADLAQWLLGPLSDVCLHEHKLLRNRRIIAGETVDVDAEDLVVAGAKSQSGTNVLFQADMLTPAFRQYVEIQGENGSFVGSIQSEIPSFIHLNGAKGGYPAGRTDFMAKPVPLFDVQMKSYIRHIRNGGLNTAPGVNDSIQLLNFIGSLA